MNCPKCGKEREPGAQFCANCGSVFTDGSVASPSSPMPNYSKPEGYKEGAFPRHHLISGEVLYWEGKPALIAYLIAPLLVVILGLLLVLFVIGIVFIVLGLIGLVVWYLRWTKTSFAITNRRVMAQYGIFSIKFADCSHDKIQNSVVNKPFLQRILGYGGIVFATAGFRGGISTGSPDKMMANGGGVYWNGVPHPEVVKRYTEEIIESSKNQSKMKEYQMMAEVMGPKQGPSVSQPVEERLAKIKKLRDENAITQEEYEEMKKKILSGL